MKHKFRRKGTLLLACAAAVLLMGGACLVLRSAFGEELLRLFEDPDALREWFSRFGTYDEAVFVLIRAAQTCVKFIPAEPLELGSGYLWGPGWGMFWCLLGNILGSCVILLLTRRFGRGLVDHVLPDKASAWLTAFQRSGHLYALLTVIYIIPGTPKDGLVWLAGLMNVDLRVFMLINTLGRIPSILSSTLCGAALGEQKYLLSALIFGATMLLALLGGLLCRRWLDKSSGTEQHTKEGAT